MRCKYCDSDLPTRVPVCPFCGAPIEEFHNGTKWDDNSKKIIDISLDDNKDSLIDSKIAAAKIAGLDMRWYHLMIFVVLFIMAIMFFGMGIIMIMGLYSHPDLRTTLSNEQLYMHFPGLRTVDIVTGFLYIAAAGYTLIVRRSLSNYKREGPVSLIVLFIIMMCLPNLRLWMLGFATHQIKAVRIKAFAPGFIQSLILLVVNHLYFRKRMFLFDQ